jgi:3-oxoacyl-(acyl-carrier-protein) synthase
MTTPKDIVITGIGALTKAGLGLENQLALLGQEPSAKSLDEYSLKSFPVAKHISDRRLLKAISDSDALGIVAFEDCVKNAGLQRDQLDPWRVGLYVGAPASTVSESLNYLDSIQETKDAQGQYQEEKFGTTCMNARPTTLLVGLPNNVLCYAAIILDARGPNSNYTSGETSAHVALINGYKKIKWGKIDYALCGGYVAHREWVYPKLYQSAGYLKDPQSTPVIDPYNSNDIGTVLTDGAAFACLETKDKALARNANILATIVGYSMGSDARGPWPTTKQLNTDSMMPKVVKNALNDAGIAPSDVGLILANACGINALDSIELNSMKSVFSDLDQKPAIGSTSKIWGNLLEAGGVADIGLIPTLYTMGELPESLCVVDKEHGFTRNINRQKPYVLLTRLSPSGEYTCLVIKAEIA